MKQKSPETVRRPAMKCVSESGAVAATTDPYIHATAIEEKKETLPTGKPSSILANCANETQPPPPPPPPPAGRALQDPCAAAGSCEAAALQNRVAVLAHSNTQLQMMLSDEQKRRQAAESRSTNLQAQLKSTWNELVEMRTRLQMKSVSNLSTGACWHYEIDGHWEAFPLEANEKMLQAYLEYCKDKTGFQYAVISSGGVDRTVDFALEQQQNMATKKVRRIQLSTAAPSQWVSPTADLLQQGNDLESFYKEVPDVHIWESIRQILQTTGHAFDATSPCSCMSRAQIQSVHRIENIRLWHRYKARLAAMRQDHKTYNISVSPAALDLDGYCNTMAKSQETLDCGEALAVEVDEKILLHGTSWHNANSIVLEGFDHRTCYGGLYGAGVYFAGAACKSHQYTCQHHKWCCTCRSERTLIIARVALGDSYVAKETRKNERRPPNRVGAPGTCDSVVVEPGLVSGHHNPQQIHQEYVIFDREQAYPCYVVQYTVWNILIVVSKKLRHHCIT